MKINEKQLRSIIRESISKLLLEHDQDEFDYGDYDGPKVSSYVIFYFNPETFEIVETRESWNDKYYNEHPELGYCAISSTDFPGSYSRYCSGDRLTPPGYDDKIGTCGGEFDVDDFSMPGYYGDENIDELESNFIQVNKEEILQTLTEYARFD